MKKFLVLFVVLHYNLVLGQSNSTDETWAINNNSSEILYLGKHFLHDWSGKNNNIKGLLLINQASNEINKIAVLLYVKDFDSGNSNRDSHSLEVLNALKFPEIRFYSENIISDNESITFKGNLEFHGKTISKDIIAVVNSKNNKIQLEGNFKISLNEFGIKAPSFMLSEMQDLIDLSFSLEFIR
tara:strand:+ start:688 stop:1239 length:552 start_codon:yes stop_codon:yes gene_type:complete